ncbi:MAG: hypothetical protein A3H27_01365 [Acidobacteria bacterium RIFCSPLOWO2_02_FULL_59_13]|nr:MAG: hypothetical protein A3H27_01365 [Acidobacteria bacterium RIFCSPLOWO2_02_FULL_59_13]
MKSADVIQRIKSEGRPLVEEMIAELCANLGTSHYRRWKEEDLFERVHTVYQHLAEWLAGHDTAALHQFGEKLGRERFADGIPLGQVVLALVLTEKQLVDYLSRSGGILEEEAQRASSEFFQIIIYATARGYEVALAESNRLARGVPVAQPTAKEPVESKEAKKNQESEISRGGQVGEFGG